MLSYDELMAEYKEYSLRYGQLVQEQNELSKKMSAIREVLLATMKPDQKRIESNFGRFTRYIHYSPWKYSEQLQDMMKEEQKTGKATREGKETLRLYPNK